MKTYIIIILSLIGFSVPLKAQTQQVDLSAFLNKTEVRRISTPTTSIKRPMLSLNTFYSNSTYSKGYDVEYILRNPTQFATTLNAIFIDADTTEISVFPDSTYKIDNYSRALQHKAFRTFITYVNARCNQPSSDIRAYSDVDKNDLLAALKRPSSYFLVSENPNGTNDYVKWAQSLANYARAIDLYLAFEIAVMHYQPQLESQLLLSMADKRQLLINISRGILRGYEALNKDVTGILGVQEDELEAGNRPMKMHAALGYASLVIQDVQSALLNGDENLASSISTDYLTPLTAISSIFNLIPNESQAYLNPNADKNSRKNYWAYQSNGGERMWAEGPYYLEYALREVVPYWHAKRIAGHVPTSGTDDPFNNPKFTNPLQWLIDIHTPDGNMPPIDDGNKRLIKYGKILGFTNPYVSANSSIKLGSNWKWLHKTVQNNNSSDNNVYLLELAIPQVDSNEEAIEDLIYNSNDQQIVL